MQDTDFLEYASTAHARAVAHFPNPPSITGLEDTVRVYGRVWVTQCSTKHGICDILVDDLHFPYEISIRCRSGVSYRWVNPEFRETRRSVIGEQFHTRYLDEFTMDHDYKETWYETDTLEDILDKVGKILNGQPHDHTVVITVDIEPDVYELLLEKSAAQGQTLDEFIQDAVRAELERTIESGTL